MFSKQFKIGVSLLIDNPPIYHLLSLWMSLKAYEVMDKETLEQS